MDTLELEEKKTTEKTVNVVTEPVVGEVNPHLKVIITEGNTQEIVPFEDDPERGWLMLSEEKVEHASIAGGTRSMLQRVKKTALYPGFVEDLIAINTFWKGRNSKGIVRGIPGRICTKEYTLGGENTPPYVKRMTIEQLEAAKKVAGDTGIACTKGGEQIYVFRQYDPTGVMEDILIEHDNSDEISDAARVKAQSRRKDRANSRPVLEEAGN